MLSDSEHKMSVVVLFGGMSSEHEVSRVSAGTFVDQLDRQRYELLTIGITKEGRWLYTEADSAQMADGSWEELPGVPYCQFTGNCGGSALISRFQRQLPPRGKPRHAKKSTHLFLKDGCLFTQKYFSPSHWPRQTRSGLMGTVPMRSSATTVLPLVPSSWPCLTSSPASTSSAVRP